MFQFEVVIFQTFDISATGGYALFRPNNCAYQYESSVLTSGIILPNISRCLTFWYFIYGGKVGVLSVIILTNNTTEILWSKTGDQGENWYNATVNINKDEPFSIRFEARCLYKTVEDGSIAIDDILIDKRPCGGKCFDKARKNRENINKKL